MDGACKLDDAIIHLNVGGTHFTTYKNTLCKYPGTMLEAMFSGRHAIVTDREGCYFIDRPSKPFRSILTFLQTGKMYWPSKSEDKQLLEDEITYFGLNDVLNIVSEFSCDDTQLMSEDLEPFFAEAGIRSGKLLYRGSKDGFSSRVFQELCYNRGSTLTVIKTQNNLLFGGYADQSWTGPTAPSSPQQSPSHSSWLFSVSYSVPVKYKAKATASTHSKNNKGPWFGNRLGDYDIFVDLDSKVCYISGTNGYEAPLYFCLGISSFNIVDIEVFRVFT